MAGSRKFLVATGPFLAACILGPSCNAPPRTGPGGEPGQDGAPEEVEDASAPDAAPSPLEPAAVTAVVGGTVWDGTGDTALEDGVVVIEGDRIVAVGPSGEVPVPEGARVVDASGGWVVPGLVDAHMHFFQSSGLYTRPDIVDLRRVRSYEAEVEHVRSSVDDTFRRYLACGVTAVVDMGGPMWNFDVRDRARGPGLAPRVAVAGPLVSTVARPQMDVGDPPIIRADSPDHARELVRSQLERAPDLVKVWFIVDEERGAEATVDILEAVVDESHAAGTRVAVHATEVESARAAVEAGADVIVHSIHDGPMDGALLDLMRERGVILTPTLAVMEGYAEVLGRDVVLDEMELRHGDPDARATWDEFEAVAGEEELRAASSRTGKLRARAPVMNDNLERLLEAGVTIAAGTDAGNIGTLHGASLHHELALMERAGMSREQVLLAATRDAARVFSAQPEFGTIEPGKLADLLVLDADPLEDLANLGRIRRVVVGGVPLSPADILPPHPAWVVQAQVDAYNARDIDAFASLYAQDAVILRHPSGEIVAEGREGIASTWGELFESSPDLHCRVVQRVVHGEFVVDRELVTGIAKRPYVRGVAIYQVEDGLVSRVLFLAAD